MFGFLNIDKPLGMTSHDVVAQVRRAAKARTGGAVRAGHAGTLDPLATGVLIVCLGAATRLSEYVMASAKAYRAEVLLGVETTTYDAEGEVIARADASHVTMAMVEAALPAFTGDIAQLPPMYSAVKQGGRKLYDLARSGQIVEREARHVRIDSLIITGWAPPLLTLDIVCGAGTYIRSLAHDLGQALGVGAHLTGLVRTASGAFLLDDALALHDLLNAETWTPLITSPVAALADWPVVSLDVTAWEHIRHGRPIPQSAIPASNADRQDKLVLAHTPDQRVGAILQARDGWWYPHKVF